MDRANTMMELLLYCKLRLTHTARKMTQLKRTFRLDSKYLGVSSSLVNAVILFSKNTVKKLRNFNLVTLQTPVAINTAWIKLVGHRRNLKNLKTATGVF